MEQLQEASALVDTCCTSSTPAVHKPTFMTYPIQNVCIVQLPLLFHNCVTSTSATVLLKHLLLRTLASSALLHFNRIYPRQSPRYPFSSLTSRWGGDVGHWILTDWSL